MTICTDDWPTTVAKFRTVFAGRVTSKPTGLPDRNFMTPEWLGHVNVNGTPVEISTGVFVDRRLFGVTFPPGDGHDRSQCVDSLEEAHDLLYGTEAT